MSKISMDLVKELREKTQVSMMDCKKALEEANGSIEQAIELLRKKGAAVAAKRASNETNNGRIEAHIADDASEGALVELCCETDFSANTEHMRDFAIKAAQHAVANKASCKTSLMESAPVLQQGLDELVAKIAEKIEVKRVCRLSVNSGVVNAYIHPGSTVGVIVALNTDKDATSSRDALKALARDICMQIAVNNPLSISPADLDASIVAKEREIITEQLKDDKRPANILEKIIDGRINKFYEDACLLSQKFIKNDKKSIQQHINEVSKQLGLTVTISAFQRFSVGR